MPWRLPGWARHQRRPCSVARGAGHHGAGRYCIVPHGIALLPPHGCCSGARLRGRRWRGSRADCWSRNWRRGRGRGRGCCRQGRHRSGSAPGGVLRVGAGRGSAVDGNIAPDIHAAVAVAGARDCAIWVIHQAAVGELLHWRVRQAPQGIEGWAAHVRHRVGWQHVLAIGQESGDGIAGAGAWPVHSAARAHFARRAVRLAEQLHCGGSIAEHWEAFQIRLHDSSGLGLRRRTPRGGRYQRKRTRGGRRSLCFRCTFASMRWPKA